MYTDKYMSLEERSLPLINIDEMEKWASKNELVRGVSNRWFVPMKNNKTDTLLSVMNITKEKSLGIGENINLPKLT